MKLQYTLKGAAELERALAYIDERSPQGARNVKVRIHSIINLLLRHPQAGRLTSNRRLRRVVAHPYPYIIFYSATENEIIIHGVRHAARQS